MKKVPNITEVPFLWFLAGETNCFPQLSYGIDYGLYEIEGLPWNTNGNMSSKTNAPGLSVVRSV